MAELFDGATGALVRFVPEGPEHDELLMLVRTGITFKRNHVGRRPGFLHRYIAGIVASMAAPTFERLLEALELAATRRNGGHENPIEHCSRSFSLLTYHDPRHGRKQVTLARVRNIFTEAKREHSRLPLSRESGLIELPQAARGAEHKRGHQT